MINIGAEDYNVLKQQYIKKYIRLELLDFQYNIVDELSGNMTKCSINVDSNSDLRRSCDLGFVVTTSTFDIKAGSKIFLDKMVRPYVGYENMRTGEIQWYNQGIYLVNNPQWSYNASTNEISMQALDLMSKLTGLRNGNLEGIPTKIAKDENVREAIIKTIELGGFTKYICEECKTKDGTIVPVPYDIEIDVGGTIYDILTGLRDIMPNYQIYFDINGVFHYEPIPLAYDDPVLIDDDLFNNVLISENINTDFESVKNYVEVLGHTWDVDYYSPSDKTTVNGGTITPTFTDLKTLEDGTAVGITLPSDIDVSSGGTSILPDGYVQLEYIQSSGTQYIDTGFKPNQNTRFVADVEIVSVQNAQLFGARIASASSAFNMLVSSKTGGRDDYGTTVLNFTTTSERWKIDKNKNVTTVNDVSVSHGVETFQTTCSIFINAVNNNGTPMSTTTASAKWRTVQIYNNGALSRNFIPCKNPSGVVGLYDVVNSQFYSNVGTGEFIAGPEIVISNKITIDFLGNYDVVDIDDEPIKELSKDTEWIFQFVPGGYTELEYIQANGNQYIDTGVSGANISEVVVDFQFTSSQSATEQEVAACIAGGGKLQIGWYSNSFITTGGASYSQTSYSARTIGTASPIGSPDKTLYLFAQHEGNSASWKVKAKLYSCTIKSGGKLIRNFVPCKNQDGDIGMYDTIHSQFYANNGTGTFVAGPVVKEVGGKGGPFWRFMGHQQAQATSYDNNPSSPFYVGDPIGSSSVGRIRIVLYGGEYDNIYSDDLAKQRADFEIYQRSRLNDSISMETIPIPWMDANIVVSHRFGQKQEPSKYIVKSFSVDYATGGTMTINAISWYPYYEESEVV